MKVWKSRCEGGIGKIGCAQVRKSWCGDTRGDIDTIAAGADPEEAAERKERQGNKVQKLKCRLTIFSAQ